MGQRTICYTHTDPTAPLEPFEYLVKAIYESFKYPVTEHNGTELVTMDETILNGLKDAYKAEDLIKCRMDTESFEYWHGS
jgi:hypothetical protein